MISEQRDARFGAELQPFRRLCAKQHAEQTAVREDLRVAEDVHQQCVGTGGGIELAPVTIMADEVAARRGVGLLKPATPFRPSANAFVGRWMKVAVNGGLRFPKNNRGQIADRAFVRQTVARGPGKRARAELFP